MKVFSQNICLFLQKIMSTSVVPINLMFSTKLTSLETCKTPNHYKQNTINGDLHHSKRISWNVDKKIPVIKHKFMKADYPLVLISRTGNEFE